MIKPTCKKQTRELDNSELSILRQKKTKSQTRLLLKTADARMTHAVSQTSAVAETDASKTVIHTEFKRDLIPHPRLRYKARRESDAKKLPSLCWRNRSCKSSGLKPSTRIEVLPSQWPQDASSVCKARGQVPTTSILAFKKV